MILNKVITLKWTVSSKLYFFDSGYGFMIVKQIIIQLSKNALTLDINTHKKRLHKLSARQRKIR